MTLKMAPGIGNPSVLRTPGYTTTSTLPTTTMVVTSASHPDPKKTLTASVQLSPPSQPHNPHLQQKENSLIISSPYTDPEHLLNLQTLDTPNQLFAKALTILQPTRADYATATYTESFNWDAVFNLLRELSHAEGYLWRKRHFYVVVFRSVLSPDAGPERLHELDAHSHREANIGGGLLKYWFGVKDVHRQNLATCMFI